jgi:hypothetical protein
MGSEVTRLHTPLWLSIQRLIQLVLKVVKLATTMANIQGGCAFNKVVVVQRLIFIVRVVHHIFGDIADPLEYDAFLFGQGYWGLTMAQGVKPKSRTFNSVHHLLVRLVSKRGACQGREFLYCGGA